METSTYLETVCSIQQSIINMSYNTAVEVASTFLVNSSDPTILDLRAEALIGLNNLDNAINDCKEAKS